VSLIAVISDTHLPMRGASLPAAAWEAIAEAELILHAGDVCATSLLDELALVAGVHVCMGNCDPPEVRSWGATDHVEIEVDGVRIAMLHDAGRAEGRAGRMRGRFPGARVVVFGHSHLPVAEDVDGLLLLNPGSPTDRRRAPRHTIALLRVEDGRAEAEIVPID
jgi:putative phosphoesterase